MLLLNYSRLRDIGCQSGRRPRLHPNGFIQFDLTPWGNIRLHVWPDEPLPAQKTNHPIHDHSFDMESTIIAGELHNTNYKFVLGAAKESVPLHLQDYRIFRATKVSGQDTILQEDPSNGIPGHLVVLRRDVLRPGSKYSVSAGVLHESQPNHHTGIVATIMERFNTKEYNPRVAVPSGVNPDNDFRRETIDESILWEFIRRAIEASPIVTQGE